MLPPEICKYLFDVRQACRRLVEFTRGKSIEDYRGDALLRSGVERQFEIAGEALARLRKVAPDVVARITDHARIIAFRNVLIHGYAEVDDDVVWGILHANLPVLHRQVDALL